MKKLLKFVLAIAMSATMMSMTVFAASSGSMDVESKTAQAGQAVSIDVSITGNPGVAALIVEPEYDPNVLTLDSITGSGLNWTTGNAASWSDAANTTYTGKILTLNFTVNGNASLGTTSVSVKVDAANYDEELVAFSVSAGTVTVHEHDYSTEWSTDADYHWHACSCTEVADKAAHSFKWVIDKEANYKETGIKHEECEVCGHKRNTDTPIDKLICDTHTCGDWQTDANNHWKVCGQCGESVDAAAHTFNWVVDKEASCSEAGVKHEECFCGYKRSENTSIDKKAHNFKWVVDKEATCSEAGAKHEECIVCGTKQNETAIDKKAHNFNWIVDKEATTEEAGIKHEECSVCGVKRNEGTVIPKEVVHEEHSHVYGNMDMDEIYHWVYCACGEIGSKGEHNFVDVTEGMVRCAVCGYEMTKSASAPSTGDNSNLTLWVVFAVVATGAVSVMVYNKKKRM